MDCISKTSPQIYLPAGFRFNPTDEELVVHYLCKRAASQPFAVPVIAEIDLYKFDPWDLPEKALFGEKEWYFFSPRERKYPNGSRPKRAAGSGYWKATGTDKPITSGGGSRKVGVKKALVFYKGKAPGGVKTNWIMHEYRLADGAARAAKRKGSLRLDDWVLCRVYKKMYGAQKAACKEESCVEESLPADTEDNKFLVNLPRLNSLNRVNSVKYGTKEIKPEFMQVYDGGARDNISISGGGSKPPFQNEQFSASYSNGNRGSSGNEVRQLEMGRPWGEEQVESSQRFGFDNMQNPSFPPQIDRLTSWGSNALLASLAAELL